MANGDYPGGRTDWDRYVVRDMAGFLDEDLGPAWTHVGAWYSTAAMAAKYQEAVQRIRDRLAEVWPPERSPAAAMYLGRLDSMIASLGDVHEAAASNGGALSGVLETLDGARRQVDQLNVQWQQNRDTLPDPEYSTGMEPWQEQLNQQAAQVMHETDNAVYAYQSRLVRPRAWAPPGGWGPGDWDSPAGTDGPSGDSGQARTPAAGPAVRPPYVPPVAPLDGSGGGVPAAGGGSAGPGPVLSGGPAPVAGPGAGAPPPGGGGSGTSPGPGVPGAWMVDTPRGRVLRAGGVIGMPAPSSGGWPERPVGAAPDAVSPSGRAGAPVAPGAEKLPAEREMGGLVGGPGGVGARAGQSRSGRRSEPYVEWEAPRGVRPVIEPGPEPVHDPGPGVIGIDR